MQGKQMDDSFKIDIPYRYTRPPPNARKLTLHAASAIRNLSLQCPIR